MKLLPILIKKIELTLALILAFSSVLIALLAFNFPLEVEFRESTVWLHVLAQKAGISLYDHTQLSFMNMNHGPLDPLLKYFISYFFPFLESWQVIRFFVVALPLCLFLIIFFNLDEKNRIQKFTQASLFSFGFYIFSLSLQPFYLLVGRSDPTAVLFSFLFLYVLLLRKNTRAISFLFLGSIAGIALLTSWRFFPVLLAGVWTWFFTSLFSNKNISSLSFWKTSKNLFYIFIGAFIPFLFIIIFLFHLDFHTYYKHFFGFFKNSGWGINTLPDYSYVFNEIQKYYFNIFLTLFIFISAVLIFLWKFFDKNTKKIMIFGWLPMLCGVLSINIYAYALNAGGGGRYYLHPFFIFLFIFFMWIWSYSKDHQKYFLNIAVLLLLPFLNWKLIYNNSRTLFENQPKALEFIYQLREINTKTPISTEQLHLYKTSYQGETVDMGDVVYALLQTNYMGENFAHAANKYFSTLPDQNWIYSALIQSPPQKELLEKNYEIHLESPPHFFFNWHQSSQLYKKRTAVSGK